MVIIELTYRDDVESLAYALLYLLRGSLPWFHYAHHGTPCGRLRQVYLQKKRYDGAQLALELPAEFGELVDYSRSLPAKMRPDYGEWQSKFKKASDTVGEGVSVKVDKPSLGMSTSSSYVLPTILLIFGCSFQSSTTATRRGWPNCPRSAYAFYHRRGLQHTRRPREFVHSGFVFRHT